MPRYRKLHVKTVESLDLNDMPDDFTRLLWVLLPLALCREGRGLHNPAWLKSKLFPLRQDINQDTISTAFDWLIQRGMVVPYEVKSRSYFYVPTFHRYQGNTIKEAESDYPPPPESDCESVPTNSRPTPDLLQTNSVTDAICNMQYAEADAKKSGGTNQPPTPAPTENQAMFSALAGAYRINLDTITKAQRGRLNAEVKRLQGAGRTAGDVQAADVHWWTQDWRGKDKRSPPTTSQLFQTIEVVRKADTESAFTEAETWQ